MGQCLCRFATTAPDHHDQLLDAGSDVAAAVELIELAVTWDELDYRGEALISPHEWLEFWSDHAWPDPDLANRLFSAALDIARRSRDRVRA